MRQGFRDADEAEDHVFASDRAVKMAKLGVEKAAGSCHLLSISRARDAYLAAVHYQEQANQSASAGKGRADPTNQKSLVTFDAQRAQGKAGKVSRSDKEVKWKLKPNDEDIKERSGISDKKRLALSKVSTARNEAFRAVKARKEKERKLGLETDDEDDKKSGVIIKRDLGASRSDKKATPRNDKKRKFKVDTNNEDNPKGLPDVFHVKKQRVTNNRIVDYPGADLVIMGERSLQQRGGRTQGVRRCGLCGNTGHTKVKCNRRYD